MPQNDTFEINLLCTYVEKYECKICKYDFSDFIVNNNASKLRSSQMTNALVL